MIQVNEEWYLAADLNGDLMLHRHDKPGLIDEDGGSIFTSYVLGAESVGPVELESIPRIQPGQLVRVRLHLELVGDVQDGRKMASPRHVYGKEI